MAGQALAMRRAGARIVGGCCGSTPAHIAAIAGLLAGEV
jgi:5-methyltetrahydrofolate--homocysteine methyltransferase